MSGCIGGWQRCRYSGPVGIGGIRGIGGSYGVLGGVGSH